MIMKTVISLFFFFVSVNIFSQDTLIIDEKLVPINFYDVMMSLIYPADAKDKNIEGKVYIKLLIGKNGEVEGLGDISGPEVFYDEVRKAAGKFIFAPVQVNGHPARVIITFPFTFRLKE